MKIVRLGSEARDSIKRGVNRVADAVKVTYGPYGKSVAIGRPYQTPLITVDGLRVAEVVEPIDEIEQLGAELIKDSLTSSNKDSGDGSTVNAILVQAIANAGFSKTEKKSIVETNSVDSIDVKEEITKACDDVVYELKVMATEPTPEQITYVAVTSVKDKTLGEGIGNLFNTLGKDAVVKMVDAPDTEIKFETIRGADINVGLPAPHFDNTGNGEYREANPSILVTNIPIEVGTLDVLINKLAAKDKKSLIVICDSVTKEANLEFVKDEKFTTVCLKAPLFNDRERFLDYATLVGGKFIERDIDSLNDTKVEELGTTKVVIVSKDQTALVGCSDTSERIEKLKKLSQEATNNFDRDILQKRIGTLANGIGIIKVGAKSESDRDYLKEKIDDAIKATRGAFDGVLKGGGLALYEAAEKVKDSILYDCLKEPHRLLKKSGVKDVPEHVVDTLKVISNSLIRACNVAGNIITIEVGINEKREKVEDNNLD